MKAKTNKEWFDSIEFEQSFHTEEPLGAFCGDDGTSFFLWAPTAQQVAIRLYQAGSNAPAMEKIFMERGQRGRWSYITTRNLDGWYYDYEVTVDGVTRISQDPYAKACGINGQRSMVIDLKRTDPEGWAEDHAPAAQPEQVIYELHVKDFSWDRAGGFEEVDRGRFTALCRTGTTLNRDGVHPTGLDYLKRLGVTHIQLLPIYDYGSVDETAQFGISQSTVIMITMSVPLTLMRSSWYGILWKQTSLQRTLLKRMLTIQLPQLTRTKLSRQRILRPPLRKCWMPLVMR